MAIRDISPTAWGAPGVADVGLDLILSNLGPAPVQLDRWQNNYSPISAETVNWAGGANTVTVPDTTNCRGLLIVLPRGNAVTVVVKGATSGDAGFYINPNGFIMLALDPANMPASFHVVTGSAISGVQLIWF